MSNKISADNLASEVMKALNEYSNEVAEDVKASAKEAGDFCCSQIKANASSMFGGSGAYAESWTAEPTNESKYAITYVVHSTAPHYRLSHLLEYSHTHWLWGKKAIQYKGRPHIRPAEKLTVKKFEEDIKAKVRKK